MTRSSRLRLDPSTQLPEIDSFGALSEFLRSSVADEESRQFSEGMEELAGQVEGIVAALRASRRRSEVAPLLVDLLTVLRAHRQMVVGLSLTWRGLYEYAAYLQALNHFRVLIGQWLLDGGPQGEWLAVSAEDFQLVAWRTLGEGTLLIDMYEQWIATERQERNTGPDVLAEEPQVQRALQWWRKLRL